MENPRRDKYGLPRGNGLTFLTEAHFAFTFNDEVDFFLFVVVPRHLSAVWI
jgi:hypothetical protein